MSARRRSLADRRADRSVGAKRRPSTDGRRRRQRKPRTQPVPHPFLLPHIAVRSH